MAAFVITRDESASLHPDSVAPRIANLPEWRAAHLLARLHRQAAATGDHAA
jgi:flagellar motility protein MotE (MotC chaperone)